MSAEVEWFQHVWCKPKGHLHQDTVTEIGCMARVLGALRGEAEPELRREFTDAVVKEARTPHLEAPAAKAKEGTTRLK